MENPRAEATPVPNSPDFLSAGFFITRRMARPVFNSRDLLPATLVSASPCLADFAPDTWCLAWTGDTEEQRREQAARFGLSDAARRRLTDYATGCFDHSWGWPNACFSLTWAQELISTYLPDAPDLVLLELGLHRGFREAFGTAAEPPPSPPGYAPNGRQGVHEMILKDLPVMASGTPLGFEPLVFNYCLSCSWLCNGLETVMHRDLGLTFNEHGLITDLEAARRVMAHIPNVGAEPGLWLPWLLLDHTATIAK